MIGRTFFPVSKEEREERNRKKESGEKELRESRDRKLFAS